MNKDQLAALYVQHFDSTVRRLRPRLGQDAKDCAQELWQKLFRSPETIRLETFENYLSVAIKHERVSEYRRRDRRPQVYGGEIDFVKSRTASPDAIASHREQVAQAHAILDRLNPLDRKLFDLIFVDQLSARQAAPILGIDRKTVARRAKKILESATRAA